ncbi:MAG: M23 family metallopeptidase [bacterium]|nr:MAG: M23 family metallopeptidase [bacterium]
MDNYLTFLYVRRSNAGVRSIRIHRYTVIAIACACIAILTIAMTMIVRYSGLVVGSHRISELELENERLAGRIGGFQAEIDELNRRMEGNFELLNQARLLAGLEPISPDVWQVGIGGPEPVLTNGERDGSGFMAGGVKDDLDMLIRQSELELESYQQIVSILDTEKQVRDATPSIRPLKGGFLSSRFGRRIDPFTGRISRHVGVDYCARSGTPVMVTADGIVTMTKKKGSLGLVVEVNHGNGFKTRYAHLSKMLVRRGARVKRGEIVGLVGSTGRSTGTHLHYEVVFRKAHRNPLHYIIPEGTYFD